MSTLAAPAVPGSVDPGQLLKQFEETPQLRERAGTISVPIRAQEIPEGAENIRFHVKDITLKGVTVYSSEEIEPFIQPLRGQGITLRDLYYLARQLTIKYRNDGYIISQVFVPTQEINNGIAQLHAVEGFIDSISLEGDVDDHKGLIKAYAANINSVKPLTAQVLERYMLLINDLPGVSARAILSASKQTFGAADLSIVTSSEVSTASVAVDNRGGRALGPFRIMNNLQLNDYFNQFDRSKFNFIRTEDAELTYLGLQHEMQVGHEGGKLVFDAAIVNAVPDEMNFIPLDMEANSSTFTITYNYPYLRSRNENLYLSGSLSSYDGTTRIFGVKIGEDRLRVITLGLSYDLIDRYGGTNLIDVNYSQGLEAFGASENGDIMLSVANGRIDFGKLSLYMARLQSTQGNWSFLTGVNGQYAFHDLLSSEKYSFGGPDFGRGYDPSERVADNGVAFKAEARYKLSSSSSNLAVSSLYGFYDVGWLWNHTKSAQDDENSSESIGLGANIRFDANLVGKFEVVKPLHRTVMAEGNDNFRSFFTLTANF